MKIRLRLVYVLLSRTFGMHQYTADFANRMARAGCDVHLVTTQDFPDDRYAPNVTIHRVAHTKTTGLSAETLNLPQLTKIRDYIFTLQPGIIHFTGPHLWNALLMRQLQAGGIPCIHTLHDLDPHKGRKFGRLLHLWNRDIINTADHILVHGEQYRERIIAAGKHPDQVSYTLLLHLFLGHRHILTLSELEREQQGIDIAYEPFALFFGRIEKYKGVDYLLTAFAQSPPKDINLILAGPGELSTYWKGNLPPNVELRNRLIEDDEAIDLFRRCSLVVLPYIDATQSALVAAAWYFHKPVLVTRTGAMSEYVRHNITGYIAEPDHPPSMARLLNKIFANSAELKATGARGHTEYHRYRKTELQSLIYLYSTQHTKTPSIKRPNPTTSHPSPARRGAGGEV